MMDAQMSDRILTGRKVLAILACFFGVIFAVNGVLLRMALSSWSGAETTSAYRAGQLYGRDRAEALAQERSGVAASLNAERGQGSAARVTVALRDAAGAAVSGREVRVRMLRPVDQRMDKAAVLVERASGRYEAEVANVAAGQWDLLVDVTEDGRRVLQARTRVVLSGAM